MKKAKKQLGEVGSGEGAEVSEAPSEPTGREGSADARAGAAKSVESMLREFSSVGAEAPVTGGPPRGSTTSSGSSPWPTRTPAWPTSCCCSTA